MIELPETPPYFAPCSPERVTYGGGTALRVGQDDGEGEFLWLSSGRVVFHASGETIVVNSSLEQFRESLLLIAEAQSAVRQQDPNREDVLRLERALRRVDSMVWDTPGAAWRSIVEEALNMAE